MDALNTPAQSSLGWKFVGTIAILGGMMAWTANTTEASKVPEFAVVTPRHAPVIAPAVPGELTLFGEPVPMHDFGVREALDMELVVNTYRHSSTILYLKRASRWFPVIEPILAEEGVPEDFKYLAVIESGLSQAVSSAGATGFWQFMKGTAPEFGLEVSGTVDERYHVEKSTRAACAYLKKAQARFGSWVLAAASYNMGQAGVENALDDQHVQTYWDLHLNSETARYVYRLLALREVMETPERYGFHLSSKDVYSPLVYDKVDVTTSVTDLSTFALDHHTTLRELKAFNPWMRKDYLEVPTGKRYEVRIPVQP
ncbi:MAG: lytic transglycosylase domain-containing protein [Bacteroidetes bacterium]|nr:lytic transglycosylase domain-containing protein [Bacteroidota bacterium]MDA0903134.1 lytic transglycosylase domain-containing protein [Bacteroidota bacterium]MDA1242381.1 lytic transglycosylase domain-containing protein [Bacteroidota bacterium]